MDGLSASQELDTLPPEEVEDDFDSDEYREVMHMLGRSAGVEAEDIEDADDDDESDEPAMQGRYEEDRSPASADTEPLAAAAQSTSAAAARQPRRVFRRWRITYNNPPGADEDFKSLLERCEWIRGAVFQREKGHGSGTPHYECYIEAKRPVSMNQVKTLVPLAHIDFAAAEREVCIRYCSKTDTRVSGPYTVGSMKLGGQGSRTDLAAFAAAVMDPKKDLRATVAAQPDMVLKYGAGFQKLCSMRPCVQRTGPRRIIIMVGPTGSGKTRNAIAIGGEDWHWKTADGAWFDGYVGQKTVIIDEVTSCDLPLSLFLQLIDRYVFRVPVKGGFTEWNPDIVILTSNVVPTEWFAWEEGGGKRKRNAMTPPHFRAFARRVTEYWEWTFAGTEPRKLIRSREFNDGIDNLFECRFDWDHLAHLLVG